MELLKLAWRNLWRNRKRSLIAAASVFFGVILSVFLTSMQEGSFHNMVDNMVKFTTGYAQIQQKDFHDNRSINNSFKVSAVLDSLLNTQSEITVYTQRIESFALASSGENSYGVSVIGINPGVEEQISGFSKWVNQGAYLKSGEPGILIGESLANNLKIELGDTLALLGQGYHGVQVAGLFPVSGILKFPVMEMNRGIVYMDLNRARDFYDLPNGLTTLVIMAKGPEDIQQITSSVKRKLPEELEFYTWEDLQPQLVQLIDGKRSSAKIFKGILFMVIGFGMFGTVIMMMAERIRELGVMIAIGMRRIRLILILFTESLLIGFLGVLFGFIFSYPFIVYLSRNPINLTGNIEETINQMGFEPILEFSNNLSIFLHPAITIFMLTLIISVFPVVRIGNLKIINALGA